MSIDPVFTRNFIDYRFPERGHMAQPEQTRLYFKLGLAHDFENDVDDIYLDLAAALTTVNRKHFHQVKKNGNPLCYTVTLTAIATSKPITAVTAPNTWTTRNAAKKTAIGWKQQIKNAGLKLRDLPTYARCFRCAFDSDSVTGVVNDQSLYNHLTPDASDGTSLFTPYNTPDGGAVTYYNSNEVVLLPIAEDTPDEAYRAVLLGDTGVAGMTFGIIDEFLKSRRNMREETDMTSEFPDADGLMNTLFAVSEELADDVVSAVQGYSTTRPYTETNAVESVHAGTVVSTPATGPTQSTFQAPLGLIKFENANDWSANDEFMIDVHAIYEM